MSAADKAKHVVYYIVSLFLGELSVYGSYSIGCCELESRAVIGDLPVQCALERIV